MMAPASRRGLILGLAAFPLASNVKAVAGVSPELARLIAEHDAQREAIDRMGDDWPEDGGVAVKEGGRLRALVSGHPCRGLPDILAKAACLARLWPLDDLADEVGLEIAGGHVYLDGMALALALDVMRFGEGKRCA